MQSETTIRELRTQNQKPRLKDLGIWQVKNGEEWFKLKSNFLGVISILKTLEGYGNEFYISQLKRPSYRLHKVTKNDYGHYEANGRRSFQLKNFYYDMEIGCLYKSLSGVISYQMESSCPFIVIKSIRQGNTVRISFSRGNSSSLNGIDWTWIKSGKMHSDRFPIRYNKNTIGTVSRCIEELRRQDRLTREKEDRQDQVLDCYLRLVKEPQILSPEDGHMMINKYTSFPIRLEFKFIFEHDNNNKTIELWMDTYGSWFIQVTSSFYRTISYKLEHVPKFCASLPILYAYARRYYYLSLPVSVLEEDLDNRTSGSSYTVRIMD